MKGQTHADGTTWINIEKASQLFELAALQVHEIITEHGVPSRRIRTEGSKGLTDPEDYYNLEKLRTAVEKSKGRE